jgi:pyruvate dehydrogenase E2 component (dihydrolipoamide acetyltransferase)
MDVLMPQLGETVAEGKITKWFKSAGEPVKPGDNLFEIETDKVSMEVPSTTAGVLAEIRIPAGEVAPVGAIVAVIADDAGAVEKIAAAMQSLLTPTKAGVQEQAPLDSRLRGNEQERPALSPAAASASHQEQRPIKLDPFFEVRTPERNYGPARLPGGTAITPLARRLAVEAGIDLKQMSGSGPHGRIVARDVVAPRPAHAPGAAPAAGPTAEQVKALFEPDSYEEVPLDAMRRTIAARLTQSFQTVPHFYLTADIAIDRLLALRREANVGAPTDKDGNPAFKLSLNDFIIRALALALQRVPAANAVWAGDRILRFAHSDIGVAIALEDGLVAPIIRRAETKSLTALSAEMKDLAARAHEKKLKPADYQGGSTAISNLGMYGVHEFSAVINPPHATILAVGAARRQAIEQPDGGAAFASLLTVTLSCDHRVVDGACGAKLLASIKAFIEAPVTMLV